MKYLKCIAVLSLVLLSACGGAAGGSGSSSGSVTAGLPIWTVTITGDLQNYVVTMITDQGTAQEQQLVLAAQAIGAGQTAVHSITGAVFSAGGVGRVGGQDVAFGGPWMNITLLKDGAPVEAGALSTAGTSHTFSAH
jgi:hypothetical protein